MRKGIRSMGILALVLVIILSTTTVFGQEFDSITSYRMQLELNEKDMTITAVQRVKFTNNYGVDLDELVLHLYADSYNSVETLPSIGGGYYFENGEKPRLPEEAIGDITINKVAMGKKGLEFTQGNQILKVNLLKPLKDKQTIEIDIQFDLKIPVGTHRFGHFQSVISLTNWYPIMSIFNPETGQWNEEPYHPIGESNYSEIGNYSVNVIVPKEMVVVGTGSLKRETMGKDKKVVTIEAKKVRDFVVFMSRDYKVVSSEVDGIKVNSYYLATESIDKEKSAKIILDEVSNAVKFFNELIGKYAYDELHIVETCLSGGAMEYPQVIQLGSYWDINENYKTSSRAPFIIEAAVHEAVHQWWYVGVGSNEYTEPVMDEALTVFTTAYYFEKNYGMYHRNAVLMSIRNNVYPEKHLPFNSTVDDFKDWGEYGYTIYNKASLLFEDLRHQVGEERFIEILRTYYERYLFKNGTIEAFLEVVEEIGGQEIREYFDDAFTTTQYYPEHLQLTQEEYAIIRKEQLKSELKDRENYVGMSIGSIILKGIEGEDIYLVKPSEINEIEENLSFIIEEMKFSFKEYLGIDLIIKEDKDMTEKEIKENNIILVGNTKNNLVFKELNGGFPISFKENQVILEDLTITNKNVSGMFIANHNYNEEKLVLSIFWTPDYENPQMGRFNPMWDNYGIFLINIDGRIDIRGNAKVNTDSIMYMGY